jgi:hypothetical protein
MDNRIFYSLNIDDIQTVAIQEINRRLSKSEIDNIKEFITEKINWYDAIANTISEKQIKTKSKRRKTVRRTKYRNISQKTYSKS